MSLAARMLVLVIALAVGGSPVLSFVCSLSCGNSTAAAAQAASSDEGCHESGHAERSGATLAHTGDHQCDHAQLAPTLPRGGEATRAVSVAPVVAAVVFTLPSAAFADTRLTSHRPPGQTPAPRSVRPSVLRI